MSSAASARTNEVTVALLKGLDFFSAMPDGLLQNLTEITFELTIPKGQDLLVQGQTNQSLYFLLNGKVAVIVDGGRVADLRTRGDLLGEMSVISKAPCAATLRAEEELKVLAVDAIEFQTMAAEQSDQLFNSLHRIYSMTLAERLRVTNEKAKHFEELVGALKLAKDDLEKANAVLEQKVQERTAALVQKTDALTQSHQKLEQQNSALLASHKKLEELYATRDITFEKLEKLYEDSLIPLQTTLGQLDLAAVGAQGGRVNEVKKGLAEVLSLLEPITTRFSGEKAMRQKRVLLADATKKQQVVAKLALGGTGVELEVASNADEVRAAYANKSGFDIVFCDGDNLEVTGWLRERNPHLKFVFMTSDSIPQYLPKLRSHSFLPNIVSRADEDRTFTIKNIMTTVAKLASNDIFGLEKYLSWGVEVQDVSVVDSDERQNLIQEMGRHFDELGLRRTVRDRCALVLEEMLMNAIYDAPRDENGKSLYNHLSRKERITLKPEHQSRLRYASDGMLVAVSVSDPFGGLTGKIILDYLDSCYGGRAGELNREKGGAGRGLHQIIENSDLVVFNVQNNVRTEVIALFNADPKQSGEKHPSFHYFAQ